MSSSDNNPIKYVVSSSTSWEPSTSSVATDTSDVKQAKIKDINPSFSNDRSTCSNEIGATLPEMNIQDLKFIITLNKLTTIVTYLKDKFQKQHFKKNLYTNKNSLMNPGL